MKTGKKKPINKICRSCKFYGTEKISTTLSGFYEGEEREFLKPICNFRKGHPGDADDNYSCRDFKAK